MAKNLTIGTHLKLAHNKLRASRVLLNAGIETEVPLTLFYAAELFVLATLESENIPASLWRREGGNHQLDRMIDHLPEGCSIKNDLDDIAFLKIYATTHRYPQGAGRMPQYPKREELIAWSDNLEKLLKRYILQFQVKVKEENPKALSVAPFREVKDHDDFSV